jgi:uncharacterized small protein (DUF1192 family)
MERASGVSIAKAQDIGGTDVPAGSKFLNSYIITFTGPEKARRRVGAMDEEELEPRHKRLQPKDLSLMGIAELEAYIAELEAEVARAQAEITAKLGQRRGAEALFKR